MKELLKIAFEAGRMNKLEKLESDQQNVNVYNVIPIYKTFEDWYNSQELEIDKSIRTQVEDNTDYVSDYFAEIFNNFERNPNIEVRNYKNSNDRLSLLKIDDKTKAVVIETRTEFNNVEFIFINSLNQKPIIPFEAKEIEVFKITKTEVFVGYKLPNNDFHFVQIPLKLQSEIKDFGDICNELFGYTVSSDCEFYTYEEAAKIYANQFLK